ncbi:hypothetical protein JXB12_00150 [candidate division KSB1 bacterium]|nr:hypothetical protein [candidate division KSB1 bacterium]
MSYKQKDLEAFAKKTLGTSISNVSVEKTNRKDVWRFNATLSGVPINTPFVVDLIGVDFEPTCGVRIHQGFQEALQSATNNLLNKK